MTKNLAKLRGLLQELFQLDQADLDFGIYRIMNAKRDEVVRFLDKDLLPQVQAAFQKYKSADKSVLQGELEKAIQQAQSLGVDPESTNKVKELRKQIAESAVDVTALENEVFSHLFNFFRRYYSEGDFISLRRYKEGVYAIPYEGEEVKLHWANADQYYVKSSETFRDYTFVVAGGKRVRVHLVAASTEQDNNKAAQGKERRFVLAANPLSEENGELFIRFEYRTCEGKEKQDDLNKQAIDAVLKTPGFEHWAQELGKLAPTENRKDRTVLEKHLRQYTARNTFDYFIHKDLGSFLRRELDFFIKNEVMHLDDIEHESAPKVEQYLSQIKVIRSIAHKIIQFLEQLENFQKKIWLKKKFVVETNYCITLDRVPETLYPEIAKNDAQREEWVSLFAIDTIKKDLTGPGYSKPLKVEFLKAHGGLVLDTAFFPSQFKDALLRSIDNLDTAMDGWLVHGENFQTLTLSIAKLHNSVSCVYIDPPYNTGEDEFLYKDAYQHSSWLSMIRDRVLLGKLLLRDDGVLLTSIGREEFHRLIHVMDDVFGDDNRVAEFVWEKGRKNDASHVSIGHEYIIAVARNLEKMKATYPQWREKKQGVQEVKQQFDRLRKQFGSDFATIKRELFTYVVTKLDPAVARSILLFNKLDEGGPFRDDTDLSWPGGGGPRYQVINPATKRPVEIPQRGWVCVEDTMHKWIRDGIVQFDPDDPTRLFRKRPLFEFDEQVKGSNLYKHSKAATRQLRDILGGKVFDNPKDPELIAELVSYVAPHGGIVCDYFAGSGTTAHAVINLNRAGGPSRKYILAESGNYFDSLLRRRIQRVIYSDEWNNGVPSGKLMTSHLMKYMQLETYDDALNNLELKRTAQQGMFLDTDAEMREQYVLSYMLDVESRGGQSLLNVEAFRNPDEYKLRVERSGETQLVNVDLVETFNWLLGLNVRHIDVIRGVRVIEGTAPNGDRVLVLWRNIDQMDNDALDKWFEKQDYNTREMVYDVFYVNGDNNLENLRRPDQTWKVRLIEEEFQRLMFDVQDV
ncbi:MAG: site-specific DNA-methyltransferase [Gemmataceae bacterium]